MGILTERLLPQNLRPEQAMLKVSDRLGKLQSRGAGGKRAFGSGESIPQAVKLMQLTVTLALNIVPAINAGIRQ